MGALSAALLVWEFKPAHEFWDLIGFSRCFIFDTCTTSTLIALDLPLAQRR
jgi:hypothetical protein